jgi:hypothetical protein
MLVTLVNYLHEDSVNAAGRAAGNAKDTSERVARNRSTLDDLGVGA